MKRCLVTLGVALGIPAVLAAQPRVNASDILKDVERGETVRYEGVQIVGDLDFTKVGEVSCDREHATGHRKIELGRSVVILADGDSRNRRGSSRTYWCHVQSPISFRNCVFSGHVIAYVHDDWENATYNAVFHEDVEFSGCEFGGESAFKYARFRKEACFENSVFSDEALFKYARFSSEIRFSGSEFRGEANFKYTGFPEAVLFDDTLFRGAANFKYTEFHRGVTFRNAVFQRDANFKYAEMDEPVDFDGVEFEDETDFRHAKVGGRRFASYLFRRNR